MNAPAQIHCDDLEFALEWISSMPGGNQAFICRRTGEVFTKSLGGFDNGDLPGDLEDGTSYVAMADRHELDLGQRLVFCFIADIAPGLYEQVEALFHRRGAYRRFKDLLDRKGLLAQWYAYERDATRQALETWAQENGFAIRVASPSSSAGA